MFQLIRRALPAYTALLPPTLRWNSKMLIRLVLLLIAANLPCSAFAQERENLKIEAPSAWGGWKKTKEQKGDGVDFTAWVPHDQKGIAWHESIAVAVMEPSPSGDAVANAIRLIFGSKARTCPISNVVPPKPRSEGIFNVAYAQFYCARMQGSDVGELTFVKAISSPRRTYVISMARRIKPFEIRAAGVFVYSPDEEKDPLDWLTMAAKYLSDSVNVCIGSAEKVDVCSP